MQPVHDAAAVLTADVAMLHPGAGREPPRVDINGLGAVVGRPPSARFERLSAPYPQAEALPAAERGRLVVPVAWSVDARLVSPRLRGWSEDDLGSVDYTRVSAP
jgi:hypothetical protein